MTFTMPNAWSDISDLFTYGNIVTGGYLGFIFMVLTFTVIFVNQQYLGFKKALLASSFVTAVLGIFFAGLGLIPASAIIIPVVILAGCMLLDGGI